MLTHRALPVEPIFSLTFVSKSMHNLFEIKSAFVGSTAFKGERRLAELGRIRRELTTPRMGSTGCQGRSPVDLSTACHADFAPWVGTEFRVTTQPGSTIAMELVETAPLTASGNLPRRQPFSLVFRGPKDRLLDQRIHTLEHNRLGRLGLFLVPIGPGADGNGLYYQAIFN